MQKTGLKRQPVVVVSFRPITLAFGTRQALTIHQTIELLPLLSPTSKAMYAVLLSMLFSLFSSFLQVVPYVVHVAPWVSNHLGLVLGGGVASIAMNLFWGTHQ